MEVVSDARENKYYQSINSFFDRAHPEDALGDIYEKLCEHNAVVVVDTTGYFQGIISRKDAVGAMLTHTNWKDIPVIDIITKRVIYIPNHVSLAEAEKLCWNPTFIN